MRQPSTASDLVQIALAVLQPGATTADPRPTRSFPRSAVLQLTALLCVAAALGCSLVALWIYASPMLGAAGASLVVAAVLCAVAFAAFVFEWRTRDSRAASPARSITNDALLLGGSSFFRQHPVLTLAAAVLAGVLLGGEY